MKKLDAVVPIYNELDILPELNERLRGVLAGLAFADPAGAQETGAGGAWTVSPFRPVSRSTRGSSTSTTAARMAPVPCWHSSRRPTARSASFTCPGTSVSSWPSPPGFRWLMPTRSYSWMATCRILRK